MASLLLHNPLTRLVGNLLTVLNFIVQFCLFMLLFIATLGLQPSGRLAQILYQTVGDITPPYVDETIQPSLLPREVAATFIQIVIIAALMTMCASLAMYYRRHNDKINAEAQQKQAAAMGGEVKNSHTVPFRTLLLRNALMTVLVVPLPMLLLWGVAVVELPDLPFFDTLSAQGELGELVLRLGLFGLFGLLIVWFNLAQRIVDTRLLKITPSRPSKGKFAQLVALTGIFELADLADSRAAQGSLIDQFLYRVRSTISISAHTLASLLQR